MACRASAKCRTLFEVQRSGDWGCPAAVGTDFYELYWQHLMTGTTYAHIQAWLWTLFLRGPGSVPRRLRLTWWLTWALVILVGVSLSAYTIWFGRLPVVGGLAAVVLFVLVRPLRYVGLKYVGDAARYLSPFPENVGIRHAIRSAGLELLRGLHLDPLRRYERIIVVGHSLGSVIAYDVLTYLWQEMHSKVERSSQRNGKPQLEELDFPDKSEPPQIDQPALNAQLKSTLPRECPADTSEQLEWNRQYRRRQRALWNEYRDTFKDETLGFRFPWRITDFVTLGSPLTYAEFLLAKNSNEFCKGKHQREFPTCPPGPEDERDDKHKPGDRGHLIRVLAGEAPEPRLLRILHHGALFACTRWTNLYFPGDIIGGPVGSVADPSSADPSSANPERRVELFGFGARDVPLHGSSAHRKVSHVKYWAEEEESAVNELRAALDLRESDREPISTTSN